MRGELTGQWTGYCKDARYGAVLADVDQSPIALTGMVYFYSVTEIPSFACTIHIPNSTSLDPPLTIKTYVAPFDVKIATVLNDRSAAGFIRPNPASNTLETDLRFELAGDAELRISLMLEDGTELLGIVSKSVLGPRSTVVCEERVTSWRDFKEAVSEKNFRDFVYRGQSRAYPLQTSFHRTRRKDLFKYRMEDVPTLHRALIGRTRHIFDLEKPLELGAFLNLAQHHGYPTPLLDWTYSPFVAAWFAFSGAVRAELASDEMVRIFSFDRAGFTNFSQHVHLTFAPPHFSILEALSIENERATPQQGLLTLTNLHDVESYLFGLEKKVGKDLLKAFDLPVADARKALNDLAMMGITEATLMPGIDSICSELRSRLY